jgi:hypothetical protein
MDYGFNVRCNKMDGLKMWNNIKPLFSGIGKSFVWRSKILNLYDVVIKEFGITDEELHSDATPEEKLKWKLQHFFFQHVRIPNHNLSEANLQRLMQVAYNSGQLYCEMVINKSTFYTEEMKKFYISNKLDNIKTYLSCENLNAMSKFVSDNMIDKIKINSEIKGGFITFFNNLFN